jgi:hypothetical protein
MSNPKAIGLAILAIVALAIAARAIHTSRTLEDLQSAAAVTQQRREEVAMVERARLTGEIQVIETSIQSSRADGDRRMRRAKAVVLPHLILLPGASPRMLLAVSLTRR